MKSSLHLFLALFVVGHTLAQPAWESVDLGTTEDLHALVRGTTPWVVGTNGFVASASNDLETWTTRNLGTTEDFLSIIGPSTTSRYLAGTNGSYWFTRDGGSSWQTESIPDTTQAYVVVRPTSTWLGLGSEGAIYADLAIGGTVAWIARTSGTTEALHDGASTTIVLVVGDNGTILSGDPHGENWTPLTSGVTENLYAIEEYLGEWLIVGENGIILKSTDDGMTWTPRSSGTSSTLYAMDGISGPRHLVVGADGVVLETTDFGESWCHHNTGVSTTLRAVAAPEPEQWFVAGDDGTLLRSQTQGGTCSPVAIQNEEPGGFWLSQAWPNPSAEHATVLLKVDHLQRVSAGVYDTLGRLQLNIFDGLLSADESMAFIIESSSLTAGTYVLRVEGERFTTYRTMTVLR